MSFLKWPKYMVLPANADFQRLYWQSECSTKGCAYGWLCTAFNVPLRPKAEFRDLPRLPEDSPAGQFAKALIEELPPIPAHILHEEQFNPSPAQKQIGLLGIRLSDAFEEAPYDYDFAAAWERAASKFGYEPMGEF